MLMGKNRSKGVTLLGWFLIITSIIGILGNTYIIIFRPEFLGNYAHVYRFNADLIGKITSILALLISSFQFLLGVNILKLREKWRKIMVYYFLLDIIYLFLWSFIFVNPLHGLRAHSGPIIISGLLIYFITRPRIKEQFK